MDYELIVIKILERISKNYYYIIRGNISFGKIEPKSRKTDGFMALVHAATRIDEIEGFNDPVSDDSFPDVFIF